MALHRDLNEAMRSELDDIDEGPPPTGLAVSAHRTGLGAPAAFDRGVRDGLHINAAQGGVS